METSVNRLFELLAGELGYRGAPEFAPLPPGEQRRSVLDGSAARSEFGLPPYTPLEEGLKITAAHFRHAAGGG